MPKNKTQDKRWAKVSNLPLTDEELEQRRKKVAAADARRAKIDKAKRKQRQRWSLETFEGQQICRMGFRASFESDQPSWYVEYLKTDHWKRVRLQYQQSELPQQCVICGNHKYDLHHRTYDRIGAELLTDLVALCRAHHKATHKLVKQGASLWDAHEKVGKVV